MTVMMNSEMPGITQADYDHLAVALLAKLQGAAGFISHAAGPVQGGFLVTELWESEDAHSAWFEAEVRPSMPADGPPPKISFRPIVNISMSR